MTSDRRYDEAEIAAIFEHAAEAERSARRKISGSDGLTLAELQEIGREVGITSENIARAANLVGGANPPERLPTTLGLPTRVARTVTLPRALTDEEWDRLVGDLRETFHARGEVRREGSLRQWTNGNLQALLEPDESGYRLRFRTFHEMGRNGLLGGLGAAAFVLVTILIVAVTGRLSFSPDSLFLAAMGAVGLLLAGINVGRIRRWAAERERQMTEVAERVSQMLERDTAAEAERLAHPTVDLSVDEPESEERSRTAARRTRS